MKEIMCKQCGVTKIRYDRESKIFCSRICYMDWKRKNPNKRAYRGTIKVGGYLYIYMPSHPNAIKNGRYIALHRLIAEWKIDRFLNSGEVAHHIDGNPFNNTPNNIEVLSISEHNKLTAKSRLRKKDGTYA